VTINSGRFTSKPSSRQRKLAAEDARPIIFYADGGTGSPMPRANRAVSPRAGWIMSGATLPLAHSPFDMSARYSDEIEQLILSDIVAPHHLTDRRLA
jgi:hypothetical protein